MSVGSGLLLQGWYWPGQDVIVLYLILQCLWFWALVGCFFFCIPTNDLRNSSVSYLACVPCGPSEVAGDQELIYLCWLPFPMHRHKALCTEVTKPGLPLPLLPPTHITVNPSNFLVQLHQLLFLVLGYRLISRVALRKIYSDIQPGQSPSDINPVLLNHHPSRENCLNFFFF